MGVDLYLEERNNHQCDPLRRSAVEAAARAVIQRWMKNGMLKFWTYDDGSDDLLLAAEIAEAATDGR